MVGIKRGVWLLLFLGILAAAYYWPRPRPVAPPATTSADVEAAILAGVNSARAAASLPPLTLNPALAAAARSHSERMGREGFRGHVDPQGHGAAERLAAEGIPFQGVGENVARIAPGSREAAQVALEGWLASPGHRANILEPAFTETGIGVYWDGSRFCCTQVFIRPLER